MRAHDPFVQLDLLLADGASAVVLDFLVIFVARHVVGRPEVIFEVRVIGVGRRAITGGDASEYFTGG